MDVSERYFEPQPVQPESEPVQEAVDAVAGRTPAGRALKVRTARELYALPEPKESDLLLGPLVVRAARTIVVADTGHGKTTLALQLGGAVLTGREALGYTGAGLGPLLVVDLEQGLRSIKRALRDANLSQRDDVLYIAAPDGLVLDSDKHDRGALEQVIAEHRPAVLVLDPYYKAHRADSNEERPIVELFRYLDGLRAKYEFALILPAHPRKDPGSGGVRKLTLHDVAGSGAVVRGAELVLGLERLSHGYARLRILKDRDGDLPVGETWPLLFERGVGFKLDPKEERQAEELEESVLADDGAWRTVKEWAAELGIREKRAGELLERMAETGHVEFEEGPPGRSPKAKCYRTAPATGAKSGAVTQLPLDDGTALSQPPFRGALNGSSDGVAESGAGAVDPELDWR